MDCVPKSGASETCSPLSLLPQAADDATPAENAGKPERILCYSTLLDATRKEVSLFRSPIFSFDEDLRWPPSDWRNIHCWHCCHQLDAPPVPLPNEQDASTQRYVCYGVFCSFNCAKGYLFETQPWSAGDKLLLLEEMARSVFLVSGDIIPAPPRQRLRFFGGDLSIEEFRADHGYLTTAFSPPLISFPETYERECVVTTGQREWSVRGIKPRAPPERMPVQEDNIAQMSSVPAVSTQAQHTVVGTPFSNFCNRPRGRHGGGGGKDVAVPGTLSVFLKKPRL
jgi:hypothetical protein